MTGGDQQPTFAVLLDWLEGRLDNDQARTVELAVAEGDETTRRTVEWIRSFLRSSNKQIEDAPPNELRPRLQALFEARTDHASPPRRLTGSLTFDSRSGAEMIGVRGLDDQLSGSYQLAYTCSEADVLVDVTPQGDNHYRLDGQILTVGTGTGTGGTDDSDTNDSDTDGGGIWLATVMHAPGPWSRMSADELGCFAIQMVPGESTVLLLDNGDVEIEIPLPKQRMET